MRKLVRRTDLMRLKTLKLLYNIVQELEQEEENLFIALYDKEIYLIPDIFKTTERPYTNPDFESIEESMKFSSVPPYLQPFETVPVLIFKDYYDDFKENIIHIEDIPENIPLHSEIKTISNVYGYKYVIPCFEYAVFVERLLYKEIEETEEAKEEL